MAIKSRAYPRAGLTIHTVCGDLSSRDFRETLRAFYTETGPTLNELWDFRQADWGAVRVNDILASIKEAARTYEADGKHRQGGRTAIVISTENGFLAATMAQMLREASKPPLPYEIDIFADLDRASNWLAQRPER